ncbi:GRAS transcription factor [Panicum miliaceum]|uniref:GRAS transcription factor n=1 Tax=Panicum miliaceum TaxID=4540 RepID=A0A3L6Q265_PANMI|nr:GRAS transcription factor [Panicum miliaceum]
MATTPEEFLVKGLTEQSQPPPPFFLDLPQKKSNGRSEGCHHVPNDVMLPYISRVLLEDDIDDDKLNDHPALLQVQQPFAQILSSSSSYDANTGNPEGSKELLQNDSDDESTLNLNSALSKGTDAVRAFLKGMEEANMLLPKDNKQFRGDVQVNHQMVRERSNHNGDKKRYNSWEDNHTEEETRTSKAAKMIKDPEENRADEMLDEMMLHAYETCIRDMEELRVSVDNKVEKETRKKCNKAAKDNVVDIRTLLISCAQAVATNDRMRACELLKEIKQHASITGDATQRVAQCFTKGLEARLVGTGSQLWQVLMAERPSIVEFLKAYRLYFAACCFNKVALSFSTMTIFHAMVGKRKLHIVDYGMHFGFQWADLLRLLASREGGGLTEVKITAIGGPPKLKSCPAERIEEVGCRLSKCAREFGLASFKFHTIMRKWEDVRIEDLNADADEVLVMNDLFSFSTLMDESVFFDRQSPRDTVLSNIREMRPDVFIQSIYNCSCGSSFLARFREVMSYYLALFDILDATMPRESGSRVVLEQFVLGRPALNIIACEGPDLVERPEKYRQWQVRNQRAGLRQLPLRSGIVKVVKDTVRKHHHKDFLISEDGQWLLQGWMGRVLFAHSTWVAAEDTASQ